MPRRKKNRAAKKSVQYDLFGHPIEEEPGPAPTGEIIPLEFESHAVRIIMIKGEPWWVLPEIARVLGYASAKDAGRCLREKHKGRHSVPTLGGEQEVLVINEAGLYRLMMRSDRPEAERFQDWITEEVLPTIRRTGTYTVRSARVAQWKRRLRCDDATAKKRVEQVEINKRMHARVFSQKGGVADCAALHNAASTGQFGDEFTVQQLRTSLGLKGRVTPLNHMGLVPLSVNHLAKAILEKAVADSEREISPAEQAEILSRAARMTSGNTIEQLGSELGCEYTYRIVRNPKRGLIIDTVRKQLTSQ